MRKKYRPKGCVILPVENTVRSTTDHITISYSTSAIQPSYRFVNKLYLRAGRSAVLMSNFHEATVLPTLRAMLIALALYPKFLNLMPSGRSSFIARAWVKGFLTVNVRKYTKLPLMSLLNEACNSIRIIENSISPARITVITSRNVKDILLNLHVNVLTLTGYMIQQGKFSLKQKTRKN